MMGVTARVLVADDRAVTEDQVHLAVQFAVIVGAGPEGGCRFALVFTVFNSIELCILDSRASRDAPLGFRCIDQLITGAGTASRKTAGS